MTTVPWGATYAYLRARTANDEAVADLTQQVFTQWTLAFLGSLAGGVVHALPKVAGN